MQSNTLFNIWQHYKNYVYYCLSLLVHLFSNTAKISLRYITRNDKIPIYDSFLFEEIVQV